MTKENFKAELKTCENVEQFFATCNKYYDLKNAKLGTITKGVLISNIDKIIIMTNAKLK